MSDLHDFDIPAGRINKEMLFPPSWQGLRQQIVYLAQFGNSIQVIHADEGGGKSSFFDHLLATGLGSTTVGVTVSPGAGVLVFFGDVLRELGLRPDSRATLGELVASLRGYVQTLHKERSRAVLLVDDAHHLTDSELGALVSTLQGQADAGVGLHVVLFAEPGLAARIDSLQVLDVAVHDAPLPVFSAAEVQQLLASRRGDAGHVGTEQAQRIWYQSRGLPGAALDLVGESRPAAPPAAKIMSLRGLPIGHIAAVVVLCGVLVWAFLVRQVDDSPSDEAISATVDIVQPTVAPIEPAVRPSQPIAPVAEQQSQPPVAAPVAVTESSLPAEGASSDSAADAGANLDVNLAAPEPPEDQVVKDSGPGSAPEPELIGPTSVSIKVDESLKPGAGEIPPAPQSLSAQGAIKLRALPGNAYVLQLMAASAEDKLAEYVAEQPNRANLYAYKTERGGKVLYILVEGFYADKASAQAAVANLPPQQQKGGPWPKKIEQIQQELRN